MEARALTIAKPFIVKGDYELFPPLKEMLDGLFDLLLEMNTIMDWILLQDPKECMVILVNMETIGILCNSLVAAFRQWYLYLSISLHPPPLHLFPILAPIFFIFMLHM